MYHEMAVKTASFFIRKCDKKSGDKEVLIYGAELLISSIFEIIIILIIGSIMKQCLETVCFLLFFCPLRMMSGGYHAPNYTLCTIEFSVYYLVLCAFLPTFGKLPGVLLELISSVIIWVLAPVEDPNKPIRGKRRERLKIRSRWIIVVEFLLYLLVAFAFNAPNYEKFICGSTLTIALLIVGGTIKNYKRK